MTASTIWFWRNHFSSPIHRLSLTRRWTFAPPPTG
jgi:hypothetical protein